MSIKLQQKQNDLVKLISHQCNGVTRLRSASGKKRSEQLYKQCEIGHLQRGGGGGRGAGGGGGGAGGGGADSSRTSSCTSSCTSCTSTQTPRTPTYERAFVSRARAAGPRGEAVQCREHRPVCRGAPAAPPS